MSYRGRSSFFVIINRLVDSLKPKNLRPNVKHIGCDYLGNNYFEEQPRVLFDARKLSKRWFKPPNEDLWDRPLPPEWTAWLRMTRTDPPTPEEIEYNLKIEMKKKSLNEKSDEKQIKTNPFSSFPTYDDYEDNDQNKTSK